MTTDSKKRMKGVSSRSPQHKNVIAPHGIGFSLTSREKEKKFGKYGA